MRATGVLKMAKIDSKEVALIEPKALKLFRTIFNPSYIPSQVIMAKDFPITRTSQKRFLSFFSLPDHATHGKRE